MKLTANMNDKRILIVEDEAAIREMVKFAINRAGFDLDEAASVSEAQQQLANYLPDLILLDWMLPGISGLEFARRLKRDEYTQDVPIIMLTARGEENDRVAGLDAGADDYVSKPFSPRELLARIKAVLRRSGVVAEDEVIRVEGLTLDPASHRVLGHEVPVDIGPTEFKLLHFFMTHPERVYNRAQLLDHVWGRDAYIEERTVDVHILRLRKALGAHGFEGLVQTVRGAGYRFSTRS